MPKIRLVETWVCQQKRKHLYAGQGHPFAELGHVVVVKITDEDGFEGIGTCLAERSVNVALTEHIGD